MNVTSGRRARAKLAMLSVALVPMVAIWAHIALWRIASRPPALNIISTVTSAVGSMVSTTSASATTTLTSAWLEAPRSTSDRVDSGLRDHTPTPKCSLRSRVAIAAPIVPAPTTATWVTGESDSWLFMTICLSILYLSYQIPFTLMNVAASRRSDARWQLHERRNSCIVSSPPGELSRDVASAWRLM